MNFNNGIITDISANKSIRIDQLLTSILSDPQILPDNVLLKGKNDIKFFEMFFTTLFQNNKLIFIDPNTSNFELQNVTKRISSNLNEVIPIKKESLPLDNDESFTRYWLDDRARLMFLSSGTTNKPKGILHSYKNLYLKLADLGKHISPYETKKTLSILPISFGYGLISGALLPLSHGSEIFLVNSQDMALLSSIDKVIDEKEITYLATTPALWQIILRLCPAPKKRSLKLILIAASPLSQELQKEVYEWSGNHQCKVHNVYGSTETCGVVSGPIAELPYETNYIGHPWSGKLSIDESGELYVTTPSLFKGYEINGNFTPHLDSRFKTGDCAELRNDGFYLKGRLNNIINKGGVKIYPADIEVLVSQLEEISECVAFAIPDDNYGEIPVLAYTTKKAAKITEDFIHKFISNLLNKNKCPTRYKQLQSLPKNSRGKVEIKKLQEMFKS